ncbi:MAG: ROK family transcriptional regulator [Rhodobacteraceae bacterium]|nr:ROK family transcriptional regulator [Paracoccaceae bacterium]
MDQAPVRDVSAGVNQTGIRDHNERLVLSLIQRHGALASAEVARRANLSPQTASTITRKLEADGLLLRGPPQRGKVGKPSVPMALNPDGLRSVGVNIGRRSAELVAIDFSGRVIALEKLAYPYPTPGPVMRFLAEAIPRMVAGLGAEGARRLAGIGVSAPFELWNWLQSVNAPAQEMDLWRGFDIRAAVAEISGLDVVLENDATSACTAEHIFGRGREFADYAYFFIGSFIGGGVVLNGAVYTGRTGNAGAFGSIPVPDGSGGASQLIQNASIYILERELAEAGMEAGGLWAQPQDWSGFGATLDRWIDRTARSLALGAVAVCSVIDFEAVLIDGAFPDEVRSRIVAATRDALGGVDTQGIASPRIEPGSVGRTARAVGSATLPILSKYLLGQHAFR